MATGFSFVAPDSELVRLSRPARKLFSLFENDDSYGHGVELARQVRCSGANILDEMLGHPLCDDWLDFSRLSLSLLWAKRAGEVYVARNPVTPDFVKVGMTASPAESRVTKLATAGVVGSFTCVKSWRVHDRYFTEKAAHNALLERGVQRHKEHFYASWERICPVIDEVIASDIAQFTNLGFDMTPFQEQK